MRSLALGLMLLMLAPVSALAQVEMGEFRGPRSEALRRALERRLRAADVELLTSDSAEEPALTLSFATSRRGSRWRARGRALTSNGESERVNASHRTIGGLARRLAIRVQALLAEVAATEAPMAMPSAETQSPAEVPSSTSSVDDHPASGPRRRPQFTPAPERPQAFEVSIGGVTFFRSFAAHDDPYQALRRYSVTPGFALALDLRWHPAAHFTGAWPAHLGVDVSYSRVIGLSSVRSDGTRFETNSTSFYVGLRGRVPLGRHELGLALAGGRHSFVIDNNQREEGDNSNLSNVPGVDYAFMRLGVDARFSFGKLSVSLGGAYRHVFDVGGIGSSQWFPATEASGVEASLRSGYSIAVGQGSTVELWVGFDYLRYAFDHHIDGANVINVPFVVGGSVDQYAQVRYGLTWRR